MLSLCEQHLAGLVVPGMPGIQSSSGKDHQTVLPKLHRKSAALLIELLHRGPMFRAHFGQPGGHAQSSHQQSNPLASLVAVLPILALFMFMFFSGPSEPVGGPATAQAGGRPVELAGLDLAAWWTTAAAGISLGQSTWAMQCLV